MTEIHEPPAVPVIDCSAFGSDDVAARRRTARAVAEACERIGFLVVTGHGVAQEVVDRAFAVGLSFFDADAQAKRRAAPPQSIVPRGYHGFASKRLSRTIGIETPPDLREQFYLGPLDDFADRYAAIPEAGAFYRPNIWPDEPAAFRPVMTELYRALEGLSGRLMRGFALGLGIDERFFDDKIDAHFSTCAINHYPAPTRPPEPGQLRAGAHSDFGSLTILLTDDAPGGLQVEAAPGVWHDVRPARGQFVVNIGDMMARWTNDRWRSTMHRVVNPPTSLASRSRRQSIAYFLHPNYDATVACIPTCVAPGAAPTYAPIRAGDHMRMKMERRIG
ncbi:MAG: isopenicillin N synthase family oxygenase [Alphaproteobacteria bacterium]|nr:isopenicillin N synthase family oxygenase [Alphaproteobacteria bacterium]